MAKPGSWEWAYLHRGPGQPPPPPAASGPRVDTFPLPGGSRAWIQVDPRYAERHPEAVLNVGGKYYRASVPSAAVQYAQARGMTEAEAFAEAKKNALLPFPEQVKVIRQTDLIPADIKSQVERESMGMSALKGEALFNKQVQLGFIPKGSVYISENQYLPALEAKRIMRHSPELYKTLTTGGWETYQAEVNKYQVEFEQALRANFPELYRVYKEKGIDAYNAEVKKQQSALEKLKRAGAFSTVTTPEAEKAIEEATKIRGRATIPESVKSGKIPSTTTVLDMGKVVTAGVSLETIKTAGFDISQSTYDIFKDLEKGYKDKDGYDIAKYFRDNPKINSSAMVAAGFNQKDVDAAVEYNKQPWVAETPGERLFETIKGLSKEDAYQLQLFALAGGKAGYGWLSGVLKEKPEIQKLMDATNSDPTKVTKPTMSLMDFTQAFLATREYDEAQDDKYKSQRAELELLARMEYARLYGAGSIGATDNLAFMSRDLYELVAKATPKGESVPAQMGRGALIGAADLLVGIVTLPIVGIETAGHLVSGKPGKARELVVNTGVGIKDYFVALGAHVAAQPAEGIPRASVVLLPIIAPGVKTGVRAVKGATALTVPHGLPNRAMAVELDVSRIPWGKAGYEATLRAVAEALEQQLKTEPTNTSLTGKIIVKLPDRVVELKYRRSPIQVEVPDTLYHCAANSTKMLAELKQKGYITLDRNLFTSPQAAMDFLRRSASGEAPINPGIFAIRTANLRGFRMPFKEYMGAIEAEIVGSKGIRLYPTEPNSFSRLFGKGVTGETFTQYKGPSQTFKTTQLPTGKVVTLDKPVKITSGQLVPVYWLKTAGAKAGAPSIGSLYSATGLALFETIKDLPYLRARKVKFSFYGSEGAFLPFKSTRKAYDITVKATKELEAEAAENVKKIAKKDWNEANYAKAYRLELKRLVDRETQRLLENPEVKEAIRRNRTEFEQAYTINLSKYYALVALGSQGRLREARLERERPEVVTTYRYRNGRLTKVKEETARRRAREERPELIPIRRREALRAVRERPVLATTRHRGIPVERQRVPPPIRRRGIPPIQRRRIPPPERGRVPPPTPPRTVPPIFRSKANEDETKREKFRGATGWQQGFTIWAIKAPYAGKEDIAPFYYKNPPPDFTLVKGGPGAAFRSIQTITGKPPKKLKVDLGIMDITIRKPKKKPGEPGAIRFKQDIEQETTGDIIITSTGKGKPRVTKETTEEILATSSIKSSKMPKEVAMAIGSVSAKVGSDGKPRIKVRRL